MAEIVPRENYEPVPVRAAVRIAEEFHKDVVVLISIDRVHDLGHCTSFGKAPQDKIEAAQIADFLMLQLGTNPAKNIYWEDFRAVPAANAKKTIDDVAKAVDWFLHTFQGDSGTGHTYWMQFPEYKAAYEALVAAGGPQKSAVIPPESWED